MTEPMPTQPGPGLADDFSRPHGGGRAAVLLAGGLALWFALVAVAVANGLLQAEPTRLLRPLPVAALAPVLVFLLAYAASARVRRLVLAADPVALTVLQGWRVVGFGFLPLYAYGVLPGPFALPAGFGDVAMGLSAPLVAWACARRPGFARSRLFVLWNLLGLLDFVVAFVIGAFPGLAFGLFPTLAPATAMEAWPLALIPAFAVPIFISLHLAVLFGVRRRAAAG